MSRSNKPTGRKSSLSSHVAKTQQERYDYIDKIKSAEPSGPTDEPEKKTSTPQIQGTGLSAQPEGSSSDRQRLSPPSNQNWSIEKVGMVLAVAIPAIGGLFWIFNIHRTGSENSKGIESLDSQISLLKNEEEVIRERLAKIDVHNDSVAKEIQKIHDDMAKGVNLNTLEYRVTQLEKINNEKK